MQGHSLKGGRGQLTPPPPPPPPPIFILKMSLIGVMRVENDRLRVSNSRFVWRCNPNVIVSYLIYLSIYR